MGIKFSNNASANIIRALTSTATSVSVTVGKGDLFPSLTEGDYFYATLAGNNGLEIVKVTNRVNDTMTIVRAQDNTTALSFDAGDLLELRIVAADFNDTLSEVKDKLEASIEETTSIVTSALSSKAPILHASSSTEYGSGSSEQYGHLKSHDAPDATKTAANGHAFSPAGAAAMQEALEGQIDALADVVSGNATSQADKDAQQDAAISAAQSSADAKVATVNGLTPDSNGNVDVGGMPLGTVFPYTGKDVPAGTLRADGTTYTDMRSSFPEFYEWVVNSGLTVPLGDYALVEGSCGYYGLDASTGTVRMPTLAAGVFGADAASKYGQAVQAGLPNIVGYIEVGAHSFNVGLGNGAGALYTDNSRVGATVAGASGSDWASDLRFDAHRSSAVYGRSDTVTPSHVKYPWVIVVYNAAVPPSVAQAGEFIEMLDGKVDKVNPKDSKGNDILTSAGGTVTGQLLVTNTADFVRRDVNNDRLVFLGGPNWESCSFIELFGGDLSGRIQLNARNGQQASNLKVWPDGDVTVNESRVVTGGSVVAGEVSGNSFTLPAGGTWRYLAFTHNDVYVYDPRAGQAAGGTTITITYGYPITIVYIAIRIA